MKVSWQARIYRAHLGLAWRDAPSAAIAERVSGRTVVVTGASSGIGRATCQMLDAAGARVIGLARRSDSLAEAPQVQMIRCDLRDGDQVQQVATRLAAEPIDTVVSNAGLSVRRRLSDSLDRHDVLVRSIATNLLGPAQLITALLPQLRQRRRAHHASAPGTAQLINVGSVSAVIPTAGWGSYAASKAAFDAWTRSLAGEVGDELAVTTIHFPLVATPMTFASYPTRWALTAEQAAAVVVASMVRRPRQLIPWWARIGGVVSAQNPVVIEKLVR